jgi:hypothetical protein
VIRIHVSINNNSYEFFDNAAKNAAKKSANKSKKNKKSKKSKKSKKEHMANGDGNNSAPESMNINSQMNCKPRSFRLGQYGWSYLPPTTWSVPQQRPPVCLPSEPSNQVAGIYDSNIGSKYSEYLSRESWDTKMEKVNMVYDKNYYYPGYVGGFPVS